MTVSPPFNINETIPGDTDIVSQHPANARTFRDTVESWILTEHNVNGRHDKVTLDHTADLTGVASTTRIWASSTGNAAGKPKMRRGTGNIEYLGVPPGTVIAYAGPSVPIEGYLVANGQAVSRTTYADLFDVIGTTYGIGDGSTTFNLPDITGRVIAGKEASATRLTSSFGPDGGTLGASSSTQAITLVTANLPAYTPAGSVSVTGGSISATTTGISATIGNQGGGGSAALNTIGSVTITDTRTWGFTGTAQGGTSTAFSKVQPTFILNYLIKT